MPINLSSVIPLNSLGEMVATTGDGDNYIVGYAASPYMPINDENRIPIVGIEVSKVRLNSEGEAGVAEFILNGNTLRIMVTTDSEQKYVDITLPNNQA